MSVWLYCSALRISTTLSSHSHGANCRNHNVVVVTHRLGAPWQPKLVQQAAPHPLCSDMRPATTPRSLRPTAAGRVQPRSLWALEFIRPAIRVILTPTRARYVYCQRCIADRPSQLRHQPVVAVGDDAGRNGPSEIQSSESIEVKNCFNTAFSQGQIGRAHQESTLVAICPSTLRSSLQPLFVE